MSRVLYQKLGIKATSSICVIHPPEEMSTLFDDVPFALDWRKVHEGIDFILFFPKDLEDLEDKLLSLQDVIAKNGMIWVGWFKNASKIPSDLNEDIIRDTALNLKLVDVKVCAINHRYSGLKLVIRKNLR